MKKLLLFFGLMLVVGLSITSDKEINAYYYYQYPYPTPDYQYPSPYFEAYYESNYYSYPTPEI